MAYLDRFQRFCFPAKLPEGCCKVGHRVSGGSL